MAFTFLSTYSQDSAETAFMEYYITPHQSPNCSPTPTFQLQSHSTTLLWSPTTWQIVTFLKWLSSVFKLCLNPHTEPLKNNIQMIIQRRNVWHRWASFLKETKLDSWKGWKLSWRNLLSLCLLTQCASSCLFVRATFFFSTGCVAMGQRPQEEIVLLSHSQWASQFHGSLREAPAALGRLHTIVCLWIHWVVRQYLVCWIFWMLPRSHTLPSNP